MILRKHLTGYGFFATLALAPAKTRIIVVTVIAGLFESLGLALFLPLIETLANGPDASATSYSARFLDMLNLPRNPAVLSLSMAVVIVFAYAVVLLRDRMVADAKHRGVEQFRDNVISRLFQSEWRYLSGQAGGEVINRLLGECSRAGYAVTYQLQATAVALQAGIFIGFSALLNWRLLMAVGALGGLVAIGIIPLMRKSAQIGRQTDEETRALSFHVMDFLRGAKLVRVSGAEPEVMERISALNAATRDANFRAESTIATTNYIMRSAPVVMVGLLVALADGVFDIAASVLLTFVLLLSRIAPLLTQVQQHLQAYAGYRNSLVVVDQAVAEAMAFAEPARGSKPSLAGIGAGIELRGVNFTYDQAEKPALSAIDLRIPRQQTIAFVGGSGGGKSTLVDLIAGIRDPDSGQVLVDGRDLAEVDVHSWRRRIGYVTQDVVILHDTLRNNLTFGRSAITEQDLQWAITKAHLDSVIKDLPDGLETVLGEAGTRLSGGQKQRVSLARALAGRPDLLLLDEATSALDAEAEAAIKQALDELASDLTMVIIAHRLNTVAHAQMIYVMEGGRIVESGMFEDLKRLGGRFTQLSNLQNH